MERPRYGLIDTLRGIGIFCVIVYHFIYDLVHFYSMNFPWFESMSAYLVQQGGAFLFVFISGAMSLCAKKPLHNGLLLVACGLLITLATYFYSPANIIVFGILSLLGCNHYCFGEADIGKNSYKAWNRPQFISLFSYA